LKVGQRDLLKLVVVVYSLKGIEVDGGSRGNDHVESVRTEITVPCILYDLREDDFLEPNRPVNHDGLAHQHHQLPVGTSNQVVHVGLPVQSFLHLLKGTRPVEDEAVDGGNRYQ